jgi:hypothetical protein
MSTSISTFVPHQNFHGLNRVDTFRIFCCFPGHFSSILGQFFILDKAQNRLKQLAYSRTWVKIPGRFPFSGTIHDFPGQYPPCSSVLKQHPLSKPFQISYHLMLFCTIFAHSPFWLKFNITSYFFQ